ncbi:MAG: MBL fold metallo-hydrolase, partial [Candidatus Acidiferrales bacterium]
VKRTFATFGLAVLLCASATAPTAQPGRSPLEVTYIANEGFLLVIPPPEIPGNVALNDNAVLIDALFRDGISPYDVVPLDRREQVETARPPFDATLVLVSHYHADHFDPAAVARYLKHNFRAELVSSEQVAERVAEALNDDVILRNRVHAVVGSSPESGASLTVGGIGLHVRRISHGSGRHAEIQNLAQVVTLAGWKILHIGDADAGEAEFKRLDFKKEKLDVAFIPFWYLTDDKGAALVKRYVHPRIVVAMHIPPGELDERTAEIRAHFPDAVIFSQPFETHTLD